MILCGLLVIPGQAEGGDMSSAETQQFVLPNGMTVIAKPVHSAPVVSVYMWYRVGAQDEFPGQSGAAHFLEHMLFKGTQQFPKNEMSRLLERTGGHQNAHTSYDYTAYVETVPAEYLELALSMEADRMRNALLDPKEFERERTVILSELDGNHNNPHVRFRELMSAQTWLHHPYRRPVIGWREEVQRLTVKQLHDFYTTHYRPGKATLVVVGDFEMKKLRYLLTRFFGAQRRRAARAGRPWPQETQKGERRVELKDHGATAVLQINLAIPAAGHEDHYALSVLNEALTAGKTARLYKLLVDKGLAAGVEGAPYEMRDQGWWSFRVVCQKGVAPSQVEKIVLREFEQVRQHLLSEREFQRAVNQTRAFLVYAKDSMTDQARLLGFYQTVAGDWRLADQYPERLEKVSREQIRQIAEKYLRPERMTIGYFLPLPAGASGSVDLAADQEEALQPARRPGHALLSEFGRGEGEGRTLHSGTAGATDQCRRVVLANGLTLLIQSNPSNPMFVLSGLIQGGICQENDDLPGLATLHAAMLDRGNAVYTAEQIADALEYKGARLHFSATREWLEIGLKALSADAEWTLEILAACLSQPTFPAEELEKARRKLLTQCSQAKENSDLQAWQGFYELAYPGGHPMTRSLITAEAGLRKITPQAVKKYHQERIRPEETILSISGDVDPQRVVALAERVFAGWKGNAAGGWQPLAISAMPAVVNSKRRELALPGKSESIIVLGHEGIHRLDPEYYPVFVANQVLGGWGLSSLLMQKVRDQEGLTYAVYSNFMLSHGVRPWCLVMQTHPENVEKAVQLALGQVTQLQAGKIKPYLLQDCQEHLVGGLALTMENNSGIALINRDVEFHGLGPGYLDQYTQGIRAVTFEGMMQAARKWFHPERVLISIVSPTHPEPAQSQEKP